MIQCTKKGMYQSMKRFIFTLFALLITVGAVYAENIKFVQITDAHLSADSEFTLKVLNSAVADINNQQNIAFVVFTGDNINTPNEKNLVTFTNIANKLKVPYYVVLGNHDVYKNHNMSKTQYYEIIRKESPLRRHQRTGNYKFKTNGFVFLTVDGAKEIIPGAVGYYRQDTLNWVDKTLSKNRRRSVVIFQHFPIEYPQGAERRLKTHKTYKVEEYQNMLSKHNNVLAVLSGHLHVNGETMKDGVYHISTPSLLSTPNSYKIIDIVTTKGFSPIIYTQLKEFDVE